MSTRAEAGEIAMEACYRATCCGPTSRLERDETRGNPEDLGPLVVDVGHARCQVCGTRVEIGTEALDARQCSSCGTYSHRDCWDWTGGCPMYGCVASAELAQSSTEGPKASADPAGRHAYTGDSAREPTWSEFILTYCLFGLSAAPCCFLAAGFTIPDLIAWSVATFLMVALVGLALSLVVAKKRDPHKS